MVGFCPDMLSPIVGGVLTHQSWINKIHQRHVHRQIWWWLSPTNEVPSSQKTPILCQVASKHSKCTSWRHGVFTNSPWNKFKSLYLILTGGIKMTILDAAFDSCLIKHHRKFLITSLTLIWLNVHHTTETYIENCGMRQDLVKEIRQLLLVISPQENSLTFLSWNGRKSINIHYVKPLKS